MHRDQLGVSTIKSEFTNSVGLLTAFMITIFDFLSSSDFSFSLRAKGIFLEGTVGSIVMRSVC